MTTPSSPDFNTLWQIDDDETATEWLRLVDSFTGGLFREFGEHTEDPAQVVFLLYLLEWSIQQKSNLLVFSEHRDTLAEALDRWAKSLGGERSPKYAFWRLQGHRFWRLMSWQECCEACDLPRSERDRFAPDASVGVLDERAWLAMMSDALLRYNVLTYLTRAYWPIGHRDVETYFDVPDMQSVFPATRRTPPAPHRQHVPKFRRDRIYRTSELIDQLDLLAAPEERPVTTFGPADAGTRTTALFISDSSWHTETPTKHAGRGELHWQFSNRHYDNWHVLAELSDADRLVVFTKEADIDGYRCHGLYELVSFEPRKWSLIRRIHDIILRPAFTGGPYV